jgi:hypothetical protein
MNRFFSRRSEKIFRLISAAWILYGACVEFYNIAWGTGEWLGLFSLKWGLAFFLVMLFCVLCLIVVGILLWAPQRLELLFQQLASLRNRLGLVRWTAALLFVVLPVYVLQYTDWGIILHGPYLRIFLAFFATLLLGYCLAENNPSFLNWSGALAALVLIFGSVIFLAPLAQVTSYPFSLGWSEGNRMWDYSVLFGHDLYVYPADQPIPVLLDIGRQFVGGMPFLISGVTIWQVRLWGALVNVVPYLILGLIAFKLPAVDRRYWMLAGVWAMTFVVQGPIHPPLLLCAILVAFAWRKPLWLAIPLIMLASYFAAVSRFTWLFAPGMWAGMLELSGVVTRDNRLGKNAWVRAISVGLAGGFGGYLAPAIFPGLIAWAGSWLGQPNSDLVHNSGVLTISGIGSQISDQALLWYRLFPNATYGYGILLGLFLATAPLIAILLYLSNTRRWPLNVWQKLAIILPLLAFLIVGLIVSVKIGGGGDLHNMDMFLLGLMFAGAIAWRNGGYEWVRQISTSPTWIRITIILLVVLPAYQSLLSLTPISIHEDMRWVMTLADIPPTGPFPELLPTEQDTLKSLNDIRNEVEWASSQGDILFMDQRQLLTFGYIKDIPLIPEYDKKVLINQAMSADAHYFSAFYKDLAAHRFSLIITNPLNENIQTDLDQFGEENNAWVTWVSTPLLCYYEPVNTLKKVTVQLLVPRRDTSGCEQRLPVALR